MNATTESTPPRRPYHGVAMEGDPYHIKGKTIPAHADWLRAFVDTQSSLDKIMVNVRRRS